MKTKNYFLTILSSLMLVACCGETLVASVGTRTDALDDAAWAESQWISAVNAPVVTGKGSKRAAEGASWFLSTVKNEQAVTSAKWMTTAHV